MTDAGAAREYPQTIDEGWRLWDWLVEREGEDFTDLTGKATGDALTHALRIGELYPATSVFHARRRRAIRREQRRRERP